MTAPHPIVLLPSQSPPILLTSDDAHSTSSSQSSSGHLALFRRRHPPLYCVDEKCTARSSSLLLKFAALPHPSLQLSSDLPNCLPCRPWLCLAIDPVHHRLAVATDLVLDPLASSWSFKDYKIQFPWMFAGNSFVFFPNVSQVVLSSSRGPQPHPFLVDTLSLPEPHLFPRQPIWPQECAIPRLCCDPFSQPVFSTWRHTRGPHACHKHSCSPPSGSPPSQKRS